MQNSEQRKEIVRKAFLLRSKSLSARQIALQLGVGETTVSSWLRGDSHRDIMLEFFPEGTSPYKKFMPSKETIRDEFVQLIKADNLNFTFIDAKQEPANSGQNLWYVHFRCDNNHTEKKSLSNFRKTRGCRQCAGQNKKLEEHLKILRAIHKNKYDYSVFSENGFTNTKDKITIICPIHDKFEQTYEAHKAGQGCPNCAGNVPKLGSEIAALVTANSDGNLEVINFDENLTYKSDDKLWIRCLNYDWHPPEERTVTKLVNLSSLSCKTCRSSRYEKFAVKTLQKLKASYETQLKIQYDDGSIGFVDFAINLKNGSKIFIEIDGEQHVTQSNRGPALSYVKAQDQKKDEFALQKGIDLHRIRFDENIPEVIENLLSKISYLKVRETEGEQAAFQLQDQEARAYEIHILCQKGLSGKEIAKKYGMYQSQVTKILRGSSFTDLFFSLYPDGKNIHLSTKPYKHHKITQEHEDWIVSKYKSNFKIREIVNDFTEAFPKASKITRGIVQRVVKKNGLKSSYFIEWTDELKKHVIEMQSDGQPTSLIAKMVSEKVGREITPQGLRYAMKNF